MWVLNQEKQLFKNLLFLHILKDQISPRNFFPHSFLNFGSSIFFFIKIYLFIWIDLTTFIKYEISIFELIELILCSLDNESIMTAAFPLSVAVA